MAAEWADYTYRGENWCHVCLEHLLGAETIQASIEAGNVREVDRTVRCDQKGCEESSEETPKYISIKESEEG